MLNLDKKEEAEIIEKMHEFNRAHTGISWSAAVRKDDAVEYIPMANRPCYGEMRAYGASSTRPNDYKPGDLPRPIPAGTREAVSIYIGPVSKDAKVHNRFIRFVLSADSPWRKGIGYAGLQLTHDGDESHHIRGLVMYETDVDPTVMVSLFMFLRSARCDHYSNKRDARADSWAELIDAHGKSELAALIAVNWMTIHLEQKTFQPSFSLGYFLAQKLDTNLFKAGEARNLSNGRTWRDGEDYNRPEIQDLFANPALDIFSDELSKKVGVAPGVSWNASHVPFDKLPVALEYIEQRLAA